MAVAKLFAKSTLPRKNHMKEPKENLKIKTKQKNTTNSATKTNAPIARKPPGCKTKMHKASKRLKMP
jgi:hypothetical protein